MKSARSVIFFGLNATRALSLIGLLLVFASSIFVLVTDIQAVNAFAAEQQSGNSTDTSDSQFYIKYSSVPNQPAGVFWAVVNRLLIIFQVIALILSELGWPSKFFERYFPVLGPDFGLGALGIFQCLIGAAILSHHVDNFSLVSAFFLFSVGCLNILFGLIFRESAKDRRSITQWREGKRDVLPVVARDGAPQSAMFSSVAPSFMTHSTGLTYASEKHAEAGEFGTWKSAGSAGSAGMGFGRQGEKAAGLKGFLISKPLESLPRYASRPPSNPPSRRSSAEPRFQSSETAL